MRPATVVYGAATDQVLANIQGELHKAPPYKATAAPGEHIDPLWWYSIATCNGMNRSLWLAPSNVHVQRMAVSICEECPARQACLLHGLAMEDPWLRFGVFGAMTPKDRDACNITQEEAEATWREVGIRLYDTHAA